MSSGLSITMEIDDKAFKQYMAEIVERGEDLRPYLKRAGLLMMRSFDQNFRSQGRPQRWRKLAPNTIAGRRKGSSRILQDSGRLRMSTMSKTAPGNIYRMTPNSLRMGSRMTIAAYHQYGTKPYDIVPRNKKVLRFMTTSGVTYASVVHHPGLVARPFVLFQTEDVRDLTEMAGNYMVGQK